MLESAQKLSAAPRAEGSILTHTWRLVFWELFLARRRAMSKVLAGFLLGGYALVIVVTLLVYTSNAAAGQASTISELQQSVTFPGSISQMNSYVGFMGLLLSVILTGALIGGEYSYSTQRLAFSRGVGRGQMLAVQVSAVAIIALVTTAVMFVLAAIVGFTIGPAIGGTPTALSSSGFVGLLLVWLVTSATIFMYSLIAFFFATLGRSVAAGIGFGLGFWLFEVIVTGILTAIEISLVGFQAYADGVRDWVGHITDWFVSTNTAALSSAANAQFMPSASSAVTTGVLTVVPSVAHAVVVLVVYAALLIGLSYLLLRTRDVTD